MLTPASSLRGGEKRPDQSELGQSGGKPNRLAAVADASVRASLPSSPTTTVAKGGNEGIEFTAHGLIHSSGSLDATDQARIASPNSTADIRLPRDLPWAPIPVGCVYKMSLV